MQFAQNPTLRQVWDQVKSLLTQGYSLIPVRDKREGDYGPKTPYAKWKLSQTTRLTEPELWHLMADRYNTNAVAVICGAVSGNLEVIDVDSKNLPGVDANLFAAIKDFHLDLWHRLRIHKSPSGGYHILYKVNGQPVSGNLKLASRKEETGKVISFLETRGEGGYVLLPPSGGYIIHKPTLEIPVLTWEERESLINICRGFNLLIKPAEPPPKQDRRKEDYYTKNPFSHFNESPEAETILTTFGWKEHKRNSKFIFFSRPSGSDTIHAQFMRDRRLYWFWTTNTEFDSEKCYQPATILSVLRDGGDKKKTYQALVAQGFGVLSPTAESRLIKAAPAIPPANLSKTSQEALVKRRATLAETYPYGVFWIQDQETGDIQISREGIYRVAAGLGFRLHATFNQLVRIQDGRIYKSSTREVFDQLKLYIADQDILDIYEAFLQRSGKFSLERIQLLSEDNILRDTRTSCYKFYKDIWLTITSDSWTEHNYSELTSQYIWADQIQLRNFRPGDSGCFVDFLDKALEYSKREEYVETIIGYLAHNFKDDTTGYIPILVEQAEDPTDGGGTGKNLFCNLLRFTTSVASIPGETMRYDDNMLQTWNGQKIMVISDVPKNFKYGFLKDLTTGTVNVNKKYINGITVPCEDMCKFVILTNYSYEISDGGLRRRVIPLEFTPFFTITGGVDVFYGKHFPNDWTEEDWNGYDGTIVRSIQRWMRSNLKLKAQSLTETGWKKQFDITFGSTITRFIVENFEDWVEMGEVKNDFFQKQLQDYYTENDVNRLYHVSSIKINRAIKTYCQHYGVEYQWDVKGKDGMLQYRYRTFITEAPF